MNERIKWVRKELGLSMIEFGDKLGIVHSAVSMIESGKRSVSNQVIKAICNSFGVNETWLLTGDGEPFAPRTQEQQIADYVVDALRNYEEKGAEAEAYRDALVEVIKGFNIAELMLLGKMIDKLSAIYNNLSAD